MGYAYLYLGLSLLDGDNLIPLFVSLVVPFSFNIIDIIHTQKLSFLLLLYLNIDSS